MSETATETTTTEPTEGGSDSGFTPPATQAELNRIVSDRIARERAKFADYKDLQAKAAKLDEVEAANKSEVEKANDRAVAAERERDQARAEGLRLRIAAQYGISKQEHIDLYLTGQDEETLTKQAKGLSELDADRKKQGNFSPREGTTSTTVDSDERETARKLFA